MSDEIVALLRDRARTATPSELIELLGRMLGSPVSAGQMIVSFKLASPIRSSTLGPWIARDLRGE